MTAPTQTEAVQMPSLPVVAYLNHKAGMPPSLDSAATAGTLRSEPLCKVSDAITYAESLRSELEAARAALIEILDPNCIRTSQGFKMIARAALKLITPTKEQSNG